MKTPARQWPSPHWTSLLLVAPVLCSVILGKLSVPPFSAMGLGVGLPAIFAITAWGCFFGALRPDPVRLLLYLLMIGWACAVQVFGKPFSPASLTFYALVFFPYILQIEPAAADHPQDKHVDPQEFFTTMGLVASILACLQMALQQVGATAVAFPVEHILPKGVIIEGFNYLNPLTYGSPIYKANGVFFLEPSFLSQFLGVSLLVELCTKSRLPRVLIHIAGLACAYSGTGLIGLGCGGVALILVRRRWDLIGIALACAVAAMLFGEALKLNIFLDRVSEFGREGTSAFERFVAWTYLLRDQFWDSASVVWTGFGAGTFEAHQHVARYSVMESPFAKIIFEFGIPGAAFYFTFLGYCVLSSRVDLPIKIGLLACILMNGAYSESNTGILLSLLLWPAPVVANAIAGSRKTSRAARQPSLAGEAAR